MRMQIHTGVYLHMGKFTPGSDQMQRFSEDFFSEMPKRFSKSHVPGTVMTFIAVEKLVSIVFRYVMFCVTQAVTSLNIGQNL